MNSIIINMSSQGTTSPPISVIQSPPPRFQISPGRMRAVWSKRGDLLNGIGPTPRLQRPAMLCRPQRAPRGRRRSVRSSARGQWPARCSPMRQRARLQGGPSRRRCLHRQQRWRRGGRSRRRCLHRQQCWWRGGPSHRRCLHRDGRARGLRRGMKATTCRRRTTRR
jgi:hypothetical protein